MRCWREPFVAIALALLLVLPLAGSVAAQGAEPAVIEFGEELAAGGLAVAVYVDGVRCDEANLAADRVIELGLPGQPEACGREGAEITIYAGQEGELEGECPAQCGPPHGESLFVRRGETQRIDVFMPLAPTSGGAVSPPGTGSLGELPDDAENAAALPLGAAFALLVVAVARALTSRGSGARTRQVRSR